MEDVIGSGGRPRWIAYRAIFGSGETLHLDVSARGDYDTGTFAYYFIRRGERHGLRIVGSLKSQPALNVLAADMGGARAVPPFGMPRTMSVPLVADTQNRLFWRIGTTAN